VLTILHQGLKTLFQRHARTHVGTWTVARLERVLYGLLCLAWGCVWAEVQGQGDTLALIPNMMYNLTPKLKGSKVEESEPG